jgi:alpha-1,2-mannosyltransferase
MTTPVNMTTPLATTESTPTRSAISWTAINLVALMFGVLLFTQGLKTTDADLSAGLAQPMGKDFFCFWSAGRMVLEGKILDIFSPKALAVFQQAYLTAPADFSIPWFYPPLLLLYIACVVALLPYKLAYLAYVLVSGAAYLLMVRRVFPSVKPLYIIAFPAFWFNLMSGQNGLLSAIILTGGLICLTSRPWLAGAILGGLSYKPQLCLAVPIFLVLEKRVSTIAAGTVTFLALIGLSTLLFGTAVWSAFLSGVQEARTFNHLSGTIRYESFGQLYGSLRVLGVEHALATQLNYGFAALATIAAIRFWRRSVHHTENYAVVILLSLLLAPHLIFYDFVATGAVIVWLWHRPILRPALGLIWAAPFIWPMTGPYGLPILSLAAAWILILLNTRLATQAAAPLTPARPIAL